MQQLDLSRVGQAVYFIDIEGTVLNPVGKKLRSREFHVQEIALPHPPRKRSAAYYRERFRLPAAKVNPFREESLPRAHPSRDENVRRTVARNRDLTHLLEKCRCFADWLRIEYSLAEKRARLSVLAEITRRVPDIREDRGRRERFHDHCLAARPGDYRHAVRLRILDHGKDRQFRGGLMLHPDLEFSNSVIEFRRENQKCRVTAQY